MKKDYQLDYASGKAQMYNQASREQKAWRIIKTFEDFFGAGNLKNLTVLDIGCSTGIIDNVLAKKFKKVVGIDIDKKAVKFAQQKFKRKNLEFRVKNALNVNHQDSRFDVIICAHVYEHVPNSQKLFEEIYRLLKPGGVCYLAAINRLWPWEVHYDLPFLSWLPKPLAHWYVRLAGKANSYYENPKTYWGLKKITKDFERIEFTQKILRKPKKFGYHDLLPSFHPFTFIVWFLAPLAKYFSPTFFWLLQKEKQ